MKSSNYQTYEGSVTTMSKMFQSETNSNLSIIAPFDIKNKNGSIISIMTHRDDQPANC